MARKTLFIALLVLVLLTPCFVFAEGNGQVVVRPGDTLSNICAFYGISDWHMVAEQNALSSPDMIVTGEKLSLPVSQDQIAFWIKKVAIPQAGICLSVTDDFDGWQKGEVTADLPLSHKDYPHTIFGHTSVEDPNSGPFSSLRKTKIGTEVWFDRSWLDDWMRGEVVSIQYAADHSQELAILAGANSQMVMLVTCYTETPDNQDDRLIVAVEIKNYFSGPPPVR